MLRYLNMSVSIIVQRQVSEGKWVSLSGQPPRRPEENYSEARRKTRRGVPLRIYHKHFILKTISSYMEESKFGCISGLSRLDYRSQSASSWQGGTHRILGRIGVVSHQSLLKAALQPKNSCPVTTKMDEQQIVWHRAVMSLECSMG